MQHPNDIQLQLFVSAQLDDEMEKTIEKHLARCPECKKRVSELEREPEDPLLQKVRAAAVFDDNSTAMGDSGVRSSQVGQAIFDLLAKDSLLGNNLRLEGNWVEAAWAKRGKLTT